MIFGVLLKGFNNIYYGDTVDFFHEFIPQLIFMVCTFGLAWFYNLLKLISIINRWMDAMIFIKWLTNWERTYEAPSIINLFMNMVLGLGSTKGNPLWSDNDQQEFIQFIFLSTFRPEIMFQS